MATESATHIFTSLYNFTDEAVSTTITFYKPPFTIIPWLTLLQKYEILEKFKYARAFIAMDLSAYHMLTKFRETTVAIDTQLEATHNDVYDPPLFKASSAKLSSSFLSSTVPKRTRNRPSPL